MNNAKTNHIIAYCRELLTLVNKLIQLDPNDLELDRIHNKIVIAKNAAPSAILELTGPYLLKYKNEIKDTKIEFFMTEDLLDEEYENRQNYETVSYMIQKIRNWNMSDSISDDQRNIFITSVKKMLVLYCKYVIELKKEMR
jgi:hypothetical protein